jgi:predicted transcriptional regulator YdeE
MRLILSAALAVFAVLAIAMAQSSQPKTVHQDEFYVVGIQARTSAEKEMSEEPVIPGLWQKFYQEHILEKIPNKADEHLYSVYTDYSRGRNGDYAVVLGAKVKNKTPPPAGLVLKPIPAGDYAVLTSEKGPAETVISTAWLRVAALEDQDALGGKRAYKADFEVYPSTNLDPQNVQADLYVGLREKEKEK